MVAAFCRRIGPAFLSTLFVTSPRILAFSSFQQQLSPFPFVLNRGIANTPVSPTLLRMSGSYMDALSAAASAALERPVTLESTSGGGFSGGGGASTSAVVDKETGAKYFVKVAAGEYDMLKAEYLGVKAMAETNTIQVPTPIAFGQHESRAFVIFEYLDFAGGGSQFELGVQLAQVNKLCRECACIF